MSDTERCEHHGVPLIPLSEASPVRVMTAGSVTGGGGHAGAGAYCPRCQDEQQHLYAVFCGTAEGLGFCGCGLPEEVYGLIRDILTLAPFFEGYKTGQPNHEKVKALLGGSGAVFYGFLYWLDRAGLIEHGTSVGGSWLSGKGAHYLPLMRRHGWDDVGEAGFPHDGDECPAACEHWTAIYPEYRRKEILGERAAKPADPREPIPSDDPRCHCSRTPQQGWNFRKITGTVAHRDAKAAFGGPPPLWLDSGCPHHGGVVRQVDKISQ